MPDEVAVEEVREAEIDGLEPLAEALAALVPADFHERPDALVLRDLPERLLVPRLERLEPDAVALERYVKRQEPPSS
jgi:hypothetical protein